MGTKFGKLTVLEVLPRKKSYPQWRCRCDCGKVKVVNGADVRRGKIVSCGCQRRAAASARLRQQGGHNEAKRKGHTPEYETWTNIRKRCLHPNNPLYPRYGGRGITVCKRWLKFENFLADMGRRPSEEHSVDRIDNKKGYTPKNCRWATSKEQVNNRSCTIRVFHDERTQTLKEWSDELGIPYRKLHKRIKERGWDVKRAFTD